MCGILGGLSQIPIPHPVVDRALLQMEHRGPDGSGIYASDFGFIGMRRLAVIDTSGGVQPIANEDDSIWVILNGEIYNYVELRDELKVRGHVFRTHSDTEVLVHLYEEHGEKMVNHLRGMFAFCILDAKCSRLLLARDRFGKKPLYYARSRKGEIFFASELKALRVLMNYAKLPCIISSEAIYDYLSLGVISQPSTIFKDVFSLPPASVMWLDERNREPVTYWRLEGQTSVRKTDEEICESIRHEIREAVRLRLRSDVPLGVLLSGGLDSSIIAYEAQKEVGKQLQTFTVGVSDNSLNESAIAERTSRFLGVSNTRLDLTLAPVESVQFLARHFDQPFADPSAIPSYRICKLAREQVTVVLNGDGADEMFGGYNRYLAAYRARWVGWIPKEAFGLAALALNHSGFARRSPLGFLKRFLRGMACNSAQRYLVWTTDMISESRKAMIWKGAPVRATEVLISSEINNRRSIVRQMMESDRNFNLLSALLVKMDMASMAASVEARSPFLDHKLAEFAYSLSDRQCFEGGRTKSILREAYKDVLPAEVVLGKKKGFEIPLDSWLKTDLNELVQDCLASPSAKVHDYIDFQFTRAILTGECDSEMNRPLILYALLMLELWLRSEFDYSAIPMVEHGLPSHSSILH